MLPVPREGPAGVVDEAVLSQALEEVDWVWTSAVDPADYLLDEDATLAIDEH